MPTNDNQTNNTNEKFHLRHSVIFSVGRCSWFHSIAIIAIDAFHNANEHETVMVTTTVTVNEVWKVYACCFVLVPLSFFRMNDVPFIHFYQGFNSMFSVVAFWHCEHSLIICCGFAFVCIHKSATWNLSLLLVDCWVSTVSDNVQLYKEHREIVRYVWKT